jgi:predicted extracellular nuclease
MFVNHWKSRYGGKEQTEKFRVFTARVLKSKTDSILQQNKDAKIIAIGDFNDEPLDKSLQNVLEAQSPKNIQNSQLYNLLMPEDKDDEGTYNYKYEWYMLDNFIVSGSFLKGEEGYTTQAEHIHIYRPDWILFEHPKAGMKIPNRTYGGPNYYGGFSDHLPIYGIFQLNQN